MTTPTYLYFKELVTDKVVSAEIGSLLTNESVVSCTITSVSPTTTTPLLAGVLSFDDSAIKVQLQDGTINCSYGIDITVETDKRSFAILLAVECNTASSQIVPYETYSPDAFKDLVDTIEAGNSAVGAAVFPFPTSVDPAGGYVLYELLAEDGTVYSAGNAFEYDVEYSGLGNKVTARAIITVPSDIPETLEDQKYQIRWTLVSGSTTSYQFEAITVVGISSVPTGSQSVVEYKGDPATMELITPDLYDRVLLELYQDNTKLSEGWISDSSKPAQAPSPEKVATGWFYQGVIETSNLTVSNVPYTAKWKYWFKNQPNKVYSERANFWVINASINSALDDIKQKVNKARTTLYGSPDLLFPYETLMTWLRRGMDAFNGSYGVFTNFNMTHALGGIREYWLLFCELAALESQYLAEGEKAFDFQGQAISLTVDRTQFLDNIASKIQSRLDNEFKPFKQNLIIKGNTGGDGSSGGDGVAGTGDLTRSNSPQGGVGILISPASIWNLYYKGPFQFGNMEIGIIDNSDSNSQQPSNNIAVSLTTNQNTLVDIGESITPQFYAVYGQPIEQAKISDNQGWSKVVSGSSFTADSPYVLNAVGLVKFTLTAYSGKDKGSADLIYRWVNRIYYGDYASGLTDPTVVETFPSYKTEVRYGDISLTATNYIYIAVPASMGQPVFNIDMQLDSIIQLTMNGIQTAYGLYRSVNSNLGFTEISIR